MSDKSNGSKKNGNILSRDLLNIIELAKSGAYREALRICRKIKPANINNANYYNVVGIVCRRLELLDEATWNSKKALEIDKNLVGAKMNIANVEFQKGDFKEAIVGDPGPAGGTRRRTLTT